MSSDKPEPADKQDNTRDTDDEKPVGKALHGTPSEVSWDSGKGRQPYANQGEIEAEPAAGGEFTEGDRGELSGNNLDQLEKVKRK